MKPLPILLLTLLGLSAYGLLLTLAPDFGPRMPAWQRVACPVLLTVAVMSLLQVCRLVTRTKKELSA
ncbi:hypothetical protein [Deinococcus multiflagellatus]|uniref:Uncharacterized protein n=1 Tax=Deinococcus multiflagellatus TaxID=1656887 RepID=A0ABW1ZG18_9DEIO|nr:hypothetical protein [Deinococcus multiflagellatus]MBZ9712223.1 hypothetical protein [Deinococcus multiflagellatus]